VLLITIHQWSGYVISVLVLFAAMSAFKRAKDGREFDATPYRLVYGLLALQVVLGIVLYGVDGYWNSSSELIAYVHPILAIAALGAGQALLGRARKTQMAAEAHRTAGRGLVVTLVLVLAAIGVASAAGMVG
jgi:heme A synthase